MQAQERRHWPALALAAVAAATAGGVAWACELQRRRRRRGLRTAATWSGPARDFVGYGRDPPVAKWPKGASVALNFAFNLEEGSEPSVPDGDPTSSGSLCECGSEAPPGVRDLAAEGMFEYGSRCGFWRVLRAFEQRGLPGTVFACALALERLPLIAEAIRASPLGLDICCHGWRWEDHIAMEEGEERERIRKAVASLERTLGTAPSGWYCRTAPSVNTRRLLVEHGGFSYDSDAYNDDLPYWSSVPAPGGGSAWHLVLPYTLCNNDSKYAPGRAFSTADDFFTFMRDALDALLEEARETGRPKMMSVGLHMRLIGHPARIKGLHRLLDYVKALGEDKVWVCRRIDIAKHWFSAHPPPPGKGVASTSGGSPRLLVTGGAGFVLCNLVHHWLESDAEAACVIFDLQRAWDVQVQDFLAPFLRSGRLQFHSGDVTNSAAWDQLSSTHGTGFTHIVAGAAVTPTPEEEKAGPEAVLRVNLDGLLRCLEWARRSCPRLHRLVHISSDAVLSGMAEGSGGEASLPPMSAYALSKVTGEAVIQRWRELFDLDVVSVRFSDVYGRLDRDTGARNRHNAPYWVCCRIFGGEPVHVAAKSLDEPGWDYVDAPSVAHGLRALLLGAARPAQAVYHLALGRCVTHGELIEAARRARLEVLQAALAACGEFASAARRGELEARLGLVSEVQLLGSPSACAPEGAAVDVRTLPEGHWLLRRPLDTAPMQQEFGWRAAPLDEAIAEYMAWIQTRSP